MAGHANRKRLTVGRVIGGQHSHNQEWDEIDACILDFEESDFRLSEIHYNGGTAQRIFTDLP
jgi:hypothetical protein